MVMRYRRAVEKLRILAEACESVRNWPPEDPFLDLYDAAALD
jgi:hypothetical protein